MLTIRIGRKRRVASRTMNTSRGGPVSSSAPSGRRRSWFAASTVLSEGEWRLYVPVAVVLIVVAVEGFLRPGYIAGGDVWPAPFIRGNDVLKSSLQLWGTSVSGLGSPQFAPTNVLWGLWGWLWLHWNVSGPMVEFFFYLLLLASVGLGTVYFCRAVYPERPFVALIAGIGLPVSLYTAVTWQNPVQTFALAYFPWIAGLIVRRIRSPVRSVRFAAELVLASLGLMGLVATPPVAIGAVLWGAMWLCMGWIRWGNIRRTAPAVGWGVVGALLSNGWWIYAVVVTLSGAGQSLQANFEGPIGAAFVDQRASLINLLTMQGVWSWPQSAYYSWAGPYVTGVLRYSLYVPVLLAVLGVVWSSFRRRTTMLVGLGVVSLVLAQGLHPPLGGLNRWIYTRVPYGWLLRDPQVELAPVLYLVMFTLAGVGADLLAASAMRWSQRAIARRREAMTVLIACQIVLMIMVASSGYALAAGRTVPTTVQRTGAWRVVSIPEYWVSAAGFLNQRAASSRVLLLPNDDQYTMSYTWGYYGTDLVAQTLIHRPIVPLSGTPNGYLASGAGWRAQEVDILASIERNPTRGIAPALQAAGIGWILLRNDIRWNIPGRKILSGPYLTWYLAHQPGIVKSKVFGPLIIYRVRGVPPVVRAYSSYSVSNAKVPPSIAGNASGSAKDVPWILNPDAADQAALPPHSGSSGSSRPSGRLINVTAASIPGEGPGWSVTLRPGTKLLVVAQSFAPGWVVTSRGHTLDWPHVATYGFLNGWLVPANAATDVQVVYRPVFAYRLLQEVALSVLVLAATVMIVAMLRIERSADEKVLRRD